jgi:hypothetical protein
MLTTILVLFGILWPLGFSLDIAGGPPAARRDAGGPDPEESTDRRPSWTGVFRSSHRVG